MTTPRLLLLAAAAGALLASAAAAHEVRPAYLELTETQPGRFEVLWKIPARGDATLAIQPRLPGSCQTLSPPRLDLADGAGIRRWSVDCGAGGLEAGVLAIDGLSATFVDVLVRITDQRGATRSAVLRPGAPELALGAAEAAPAALAYLGLGVEHILLGIDHLLFVLALLLLVEGRRRLVVTITAFTVAHSLTLAAATLGWVRVAQAPVEAVIALSIVFVACEIAHARQGRSGWTHRAPWTVAFSFGLLHGLGFAGALSEVGLPEQAIPLALLLFNLGVEAGQLLFVAAVLGVGALAARLPLRAPGWLGWAPAYGIGSVAALWTVERVMGSFS